MEEQYGLRPIHYKGRFLCYELVSLSASESELERFQKDPKRAQDLVKLFEHIEKIQKYGIFHACRINLARSLEASINLYELKNYSGALREMSCVVVTDAKETKVVLLFEFTGHSGKGGIPPNKMKQAKMLSSEASRLLNEEGVL